MEINDLTTPPNTPLALQAFRSCFLAPASLPFFSSFTSSFLISKRGSLPCLPQTTAQFTFNPLSTKNAVKPKIRTWAQLVNALIDKKDEDQGSILSNTEDANNTKNILRVCGDGFRLLLLFERQSSCAHAAGTALCAQHS